MKLTNDQLMDWFFTANTKFRPEARAMMEGYLKSPPVGATRSDVVRGLKEGINDTLTKATWWTPEKRASVDGALLSKGLPSVGQMLLILRKRHIAILKRGRIRNDEEFYIVKEVVSCLDFGVGTDERAAFDKMLYQYESKTKTA
jgi:hypothetical protein